MAPRANEKSVRDPRGYSYGGTSEHGISVDDNHVWVTGGDVVLKFTSSKKFVLQIGEYGKTGGSNDTRLLGKATDAEVYPATNEVFVSDGYANRRVIVFDANTGAYKRHWGAYGEKPDDGPPVLYEPDKPLPRQFFITHCLRLSKDGLVYVCDRQRNRVQVFRTDGTFVHEAVVHKDAPAGAGITIKGPAFPVAQKAGFGSVNGLAFSADPEQRYLYAAGARSRIVVLRRSDLKELGEFESGGSHHIATDSKGNFYITGRQIPARYLFKGVPGATGD
jgi:hypothetical protein